MAGRIVHVCLSVRGALLNWGDREFRRAGFRDEAGRVLSPREARMALMDHLAGGREFIPLGEPCDGFDYVKGCPGHDATPS